MQEIIQKAEKGTLVRKGQHTILTVTGTPYEMGLSHGILFKDSIKTYFKESRRSLRKDLSFIPNLLSHIEYHISKRYLPAEDMEELRGIADGAELKLNDVIRFNYGSFLMIAIFAKMSACTQFSVSGKYTKNNELIHAKNVDWMHLNAAHRYLIMAEYHPANGKSYTTPVNIGGIYPEFPINEDGITISPNLAMSCKPTIRGMPDNILCRRIARYAGSISEALRVIKDAGKIQTAGFQMMITDGKTSESIVVELMDGKTNLVYPSSDKLVITNHFTSKEFAKYQPKAQKDPWTLCRFQRIHDLLEQNKGAIDVNMAVSFLGDHLDLETGQEMPSKRTVCSHDDGEKIFAGLLTRPAVTSTVSAVALPAQKKIFASFGSINAPHDQYMEYGISQIKM